MQMFSKIFTNYSTVKLGVLVWKYKFLSQQYKKAQKFENLVFRYTYLKYHKCIMKKNGGDHVWWITLYLTML